ncbi:hypothetical protein OKA04_09085 [Luteolibacter flavescens]|uniref:Uncharacterized protein n=1 Tax=Luteolibacter flavescens TaxID=1859460 RepID=A0ABT3FMT3_9BACT|nr:hypothetical protein [Luteolibacter flavescens]MCW1884881.1 hypothetical protein [Luteolibacter flavescens]
MLTSFRAAAVLAAAFLCAHAEAASVRFLAWDHQVSSLKLMVRHDGKDRPIVDLHADKRSEPVTDLPGDAELILVNPAAKGPEGDPATVAVKIPQGLAEPLVILLPDAAGDAGVRGFAVDDSSAGFKYGTTRFLNTTGKPLAVRCEKSVLRLDKSWVPVDVDPGGAARNVPVQMAPAEKTSTVLYSSIWEYDPGVRKLALILAGTAREAGMIQVKIITERRRDPAP